mmetsp:Transcript_43261/g.127229  ORF Transcript_43261/g.127229 Transcript_43261/m.127229 type:complete len:313 (-) Transcript_43261:475-1413(-)
MYRDKGLLQCCICERLVYRSRFMGRHRLLVHHKIDGTSTEHDERSKHRIARERGTLVQCIAKHFNAVYNAASCATEQLQLGADGCSHENGEAPVGIDESRVSCHDGCAGKSIVAVDAKEIDIAATSAVGPSGSQREGRAPGENVHPLAGRPGLLQLFVKVARSPLVVKLSSRDGLQPAHARERLDDSLPGQVVVCIHIRRDRRPMHRWHKAMVEYRREIDRWPHGHNDDADSRRIISAVSNPTGCLRHIRAVGEGPPMPRHLLVGSGRSEQNAAVGGSTLLHSAQRRLLVPRGREQPEQLIAAARLRRFGLR